MGLGGRVSACVHNLRQNNIGERWFGEVLGSSMIGFVSSGQSLATIHLSFPWQLISHLGCRSL